MQPVTLFCVTLATLTAAAPVPEAGPEPIPQLSLGGAQNGVTQGSCKPVTLIFARGTFELSNMGSVVGPSLAQDLGQAIGTQNLAVQGVNYAADVGGIFTEITGGAGTQAMLSVAQQALSKCPDTKLVLSGYSQGAMLVHNTASRMGDAASKVVAAVTFGDPFKSVALKGIPAEKFKTFCATADPVCGLGGVSALSGMVSSGGDQSSSMASHLGYGADAPAAAKFIQGRIGS
ncbi:Cutinase [Macrophomina phaseolina MS6]|uniref:Cutinase n=1 Tax=Macrophomina phaseolina (strain MS6) TaxID=1126212 RepID=K2S0W0_MACPH|nr:Cutinase [Macrophomina phaseolina MS6]